MILPRDSSTHGFRKVGSREWVSLWAKCPSSFAMGPLPFSAIFMGVPSPCGNYFGSLEGEKSLCWATFVTADRIRAGSLTCSSLGNHEEWFADWALRGELHRMIYNGGMGAHATFLSYGVKGTYTEVRRAFQQVPTAHKDFLRSLHHVAGLTVCGDAYWLVHAGINSMLVYELGEDADVRRVVPGLHRRKSLAAHWNRGGPQDSAPVDRPVIMGHVCQEQPVLEEHVLAIDTGAGTTPNGRLSALLLPERRVVSVEAPGTRL